MKSDLVAIAGIIGVGKTTLAGQLANIMHGEVIHEQYGENPFLAREVAGDKQASLPSELFFLLSRARQLDRQMIAGSGLLIADYIFEKNRIFAEINLTSHQFAIYDELERAVMKYIARPQVVIYLRDSIENCLKRIASRGRSFEKNISYPYMKRLYDAYESFFAGMDGPGLICLDCSEYDLRRVEAVKPLAEKLTALLKI